MVEGKNGPTQGQIFILDQQSEGGLKGIRAMFYDGTDLPLSAGDIKHTEITSRDIDRQDYPHYFLKEISESPDSMDKTLQNRWKVSEKDSNQYVISLDKTVIPQRLKQALEEDRIRACEHLLPFEKKQDPIWRSRWCVSCSYSTRITEVK